MLEKVKTQAIPFSEVSDGVFFRVARGEGPLMVSVNDADLPRRLRTGDDDSAFFAVVRIIEKKTEPNEIMVEEIDCDVVEETTLVVPEQPVVNVSKGASVIFRYRSRTGCQHMHLGRINEKLEFQRCNRTHRGHRGRRNKRPD